jgi:hypothetical protein
VTSDALLLLLSEGSGVLVCPCLIKGLACGSYGNDKSLLLSMHGSGGGLSRGVLLLPLDDGGLLLIGGGEVGVTAGIVSKMMVVRGGGGRRRALGLGQR